MTARVQLKKKSPGCQSQRAWHHDFILMPAGCEIGTSQQGQKQWNTEAEESMVLRAATKQ
jgi:hypothetical protein